MKRWVGILLVKFNTTAVQISPQLCFDNQKDGELWSKKKNSELQSWQVLSVPLPTGQSVHLMQFFGMLGIVGINAALIEIPKYSEIALSSKMPDKPPILPS